jgi:hypothetical protein
VAPGLSHSRRSIPGSMSPEVSMSGCDTKRKCQGVLGISGAGAEIAKRLAHEPAVKQSKSRADDWA